MIQSHFAMFAHYNEWANRRLYANAAALPDADFRAEHGAYFGSVHGTLNHLLVTDRLWQNRFTGAGETYARLDRILFTDLDELRAAREAEDARIIAWVCGLDEEALAGSFTYRTIVNPMEVTQKLAPAL